MNKTDTQYWIDRLIEEDRIIRPIVEKLENVRYKEVDATDLYLLRESLRNRRVYAEFLYKAANPPIEKKSKFRKILMKYI